MDEHEFRAYLKRGGRSPRAQNRVMAYVLEYERFLEEQRGGTGIDAADGDDLEAFVAWVELAPKTSANKHLWALCYYYDFVSNEELRTRAGELRQQRIKRKPFVLGDFRGVNAETAARLAATGIRNVEQMLAAGGTPSARKELADRTGVPMDDIVEFVKLSDLSRLGGVKAIRARLYCDAGVDTLEKMAQWDPKQLRAMLIEFVERTGFEGIAPLPKEARNAVKTAGELPRMVEYG
jgi:hypothetical protein